MTCLPDFHRLRLQKTASRLLTFAYSMASPRQLPLVIALGERARPQADTCTLKAGKPFNRRLKDGFVPDKITHSPNKAMYRQQPYDMNHSASTRFATSTTTNTALVKRFWPNATAHVWGASWSIYSNEDPQKVIGEGKTEILAWEAAARRVKATAKGASGR